MVDPATAATRLVAKPTERPDYTLRRDGSAHSALTRGLAEYLLQQTYEAPGGGRVQIARGAYDWADADAGTQPIYPAAVVYVPEKFAYSTSKSAPGLLDRDAQIAPGQWMATPNSARADLTAEIWCAKQEERDSIVQMVNDALVPVDWMNCVRVALPHYHGVFVEYTLLDHSYADSADEATRNHWIVRFTVRGHIPVVRIYNFVEGRGVARVRNVGPGVTP